MAVEAQSPRPTNNSINNTTSTTSAVDQLKLQKLLEMDDELQLLQQRKKELERTTAQLEVQLNSMEKKYLEQTPAGNISTGFSGYMASFYAETNGNINSVSSGYGSQQQQHNRRSVNIFGQIGSSHGGITESHIVQDSDLVLSMSSNTLRKSLQLVQEMEANTRINVAGSGGAISGGNDAGTGASSASASRRKKSIVKLSLA